MDRRELSQIGCGADRQRFGDGGMRVLPVRERAFGFARDELVANRTSSVTDFTMPGMPDM
jgi:hypothetical protein